ALKAEKKILRKAVTATLRDLSTAYIQDQSRGVTTRVLALPSFAQSKHVGCYLSMPGGEVDTSTLVREILRSGKTLFVPKIDTATEGRMELLQIYDEADLNALPSGVWGIKEPDRVRDGRLRTSAIDVGLDMIFLPGLAFDRSFSRLGHGKGYYDRFITAYSESSRPPPVLVGLALREQLLDTVPTDAHDWRMDCVV
ncbi:5-formyltetrahydrofolate cyclo-ligase, partial [Mycena rosella]